ncbi:hypothetical protein EVAR_92101_1 [Eumeta japonica]|uniref:Uncharacterized protein n=1 Tax=Eumeta variegata TaxID=151549 RepID=A0A4C1SZ87_EUMVA|nr:hypothetical protein EVAR_92101_1 [Eumeta japonica]
MVTAAHGLFQPHKSHQCASALLSSLIRIGYLIKELFEKWVIGNLTHWTIHATAEAPTSHLYSETGGRPTAHVDSYKKLCISQDETQPSVCLRALFIPKACISGRSPFEIRTLATVARALIFVYVVTANAIEAQKNRPSANRDGSILVIGGLANSSQIKSFAACLEEQIKSCKTKTQCRHRLSAAPNSHGAGAKSFSSKLLDYKKKNPIHSTSAVPPARQLSGRPLCCRRDSLRISATFAKHLSHKYDGVGDTDDGSGPGARPSAGTARARPGPDAEALKPRTRIVP